MRKERRGEARRRETRGPGARKGGKRRAEGVEGGVERREEGASGARKGGRAGGARRTGEGAAEGEGGGAGAGARRGRTLRELRLARGGAIRYTTFSLREKHHANVAQLVEQRTRNAQVSGSSPLVGSRRQNGPRTPGAVLRPGPIPRLRHGGGRKARAQRAKDCPRPRPSAAESVSRETLARASTQGHPRPSSLIIISG